LGLFEGESSLLSSNLPSSDPLAPPNIIETVLVQEPMDHKDIGEHPDVPIE